MVEKDYVMRIVHEMIRTLIRLIFQKDIDEGEEIIFDEETRQRNELLKKLIDAGEIEEAENRLLDEMEHGSGVTLEAALMFYEYLNGKTNDFLESHNFSRKEVIEGVCYVSSHYGYGSMAESLMEEGME